MRRIRWIIALMLPLTAVAVAESLPDPTQPADFIASQSGSGPSSAGPAAPTGPVLQSTLVSPQRKSAVISGRQVKIGDTFEGAVVVDITPYEVRLRREGRESSLRLLPKLAKEKGKVE